MKHTEMPGVAGSAAVGIRLAVAVVVLHHGLGRLGTGKRNQNDQDQNGLEPDPNCGVQAHPQDDFSIPSKLSIGFTSLQRKGRAVTGEGAYFPWTS